MRWITPLVLAILIAPVVSRADWLPGGTILRERTNSSSVNGSCVPTINGGLIAYTSFDSGPSFPDPGRFELFDGDCDRVPGWSAELPPGYQTVHTVLPDGAGGLYAILRSASGENRLHHVGGGGATSPGWPATGIVVDRPNVAPEVRVDPFGGIWVVWRGIGFLHYDAAGTSSSLIPDGAPGRFDVDANARLVRVSIDGSGACRVQAFDPSGSPAWPTPTLIATQVSSAEVRASGTSVYVYYGWDAAPAGTTPARIQCVAANGSLMPGWPADGYEPWANGIFEPRPNGTFLMIPSGGDLMLLGPSPDGFRIVRRLVTGAADPSWPTPGILLSGRDGYNWLPLSEPSGAVSLMWTTLDGLYATFLRRNGTTPGDTPGAGRLLSSNVTSAGGAYSWGLSRFGQQLPIASWLEYSGRWTYRAQRIDLADIVPVQSSLALREVFADRVHLVWELGEASSQVIVERREGVAGEWRERARLAPDGERRVDFTDAAVVAGAEYDYRLRLGADTSQLAHVTVPRVALALTGLVPNPGRVGATIHFALPGSEAAHLELYDLAGRRVWTHTHVPTAAGANQVRLEPTGALAHGVYLLRLRQSGVSLARRLVIAD